MRAVLVAIMFLGASAVASDAWYPRRMTSGGGAGGGGGCTGDCTFNSVTVSSTTNPVVLPTNGELCFNGATCTARAVSDGNSITILAPLGLSLQGGVSVANTNLDVFGSAYITNGFGGGVLVRDGMVFKNSGGTTKTTIDGPTGKITLDATDTSGTPGAATVNKPSGQASIAASAASVVITNSTISATSVVLPILQANDATCTSIKHAIPAAGSVTITVNAACTANTKIGWVVFN